MFLTAAALYSLSTVIATGVGGGVTGAAATAAVINILNNTDDTEKTAKLQQLEEELLALYAELPEHAKAFTLNTAENTKKILVDTIEIQRILQASAKHFDIEINTINASNERLGGANITLQHVTELIHNNLQDIIASLKSRQENLALITDELKLTHEKLSGTQERLQATQETQSSLQERLNSRITTSQALVKKSLALEQKTEELTTGLLQSVSENRALKAENARLKQMIEALKTPKQDINATKNKDNPPPKSPSFF